MSNINTPAIHSKDYMIKNKDTFLAKGEALVRGIFSEACFREKETVK